MQLGIREEEEEPLIAPRKSGCCSCWSAIRQSKKTAVVVLFIAFLLDAMLLTVVEPVLPEILSSISSQAEKSNIISDQGARNHSPQITTSVYMTSHTPGPTEPSQTADPIALGILNGAKPLTQVILNPLFGFVVDRTGHTIPMLIGFLIAFVSTAGFAYARQYVLLLFTRCFQGIGSSLLTIAGLTMVSSVYTEPEERGKAMAVAFSGLALGLVVGFPFGSIFFQLYGRRFPFQAMAAMILVGAAIRFLVMPWKVRSSKVAMQSDKGCSSLAVFCDIYIVVASGVYFWLCYGIGGVMGIGPLFLLDELFAEQWQIGVIFLIGAVFQNIFQYACGAHAHKVDWWPISMIGLMLVGLGVAAYTSMPSLWYILIPQCVYAAGIGMVMCSIPPFLGYLADIRVNSRYGAVFALSDTGTNLGYFLGSLITGILVDRFGFFISFVATGVVVFLYSFVCIGLKDVPFKHFDPEKVRVVRARSRHYSFSASYARSLP